MATFYLLVSPGICIARLSLGDSNFLVKSGHAKHNQIYYVYILGALEFALQGPQAGRQGTLFVENSVCVFSGEKTQTLFSMKYRVCVVA